MITNKNPRRYEISLWTLQDSFITVLKSFNLDNFGTIENPQLELSDDSEDRLSFRLPMYIKENGVFKENPIWYNITNGNLIINLRKLKLIFFKGTNQLRIFEFVITNVKESHEGFEKYCEIEAEGLAYNDLGKTGFTIDLSLELYELECEEGLKLIDNFSLLEYSNELYYLKLSLLSLLIDDLSVYGTFDNSIINITPTNIVYDLNNYEVTIYFDTNYNCSLYTVSYKYEPINNINYWLDKIFPPTFSWSYRINMNWENDYYNENRRSDKIYEDAFIENWDFNEENKLVPTNIVDSKEKLRIITESESNRYNLTLSIALTFGVYCRYIYEYDDNLHITNKIVEFYNNALKEDEEIIDFTYYYDTESILREMDSADLVSKMFVIGSNDEGLLTDSIINVDANKTLEDYLLNFDYLYKTGGIDDELKEYIEEFEIEMREYNLLLQNLSNKITICSNALNGREGFKVKRDNAKILALEALEALEDENAHLLALKKSDEIDYDNNLDTLSMTGINPDCVVLNENEEDGLSCKINKDGVIPSSIIVFTSLDAAAQFHDIIYGTKASRRLKSEIIFNEETEFYEVIFYELTDENSNSIVINDQCSSYNEAYNSLALYIIDNIVSELSLPSSKYQVTIDPETGFAIGLEHIICDPDENRVLYLVYNYNLQLYHEELKNKWQNILNELNELYEIYAEVVNIIDGERDENDEWISDNKGLLQEYYDEYDELLKEKKLKILEFESYLGPALREGTWQPDDNYAKYGDKRTIDLFLNNNSLFKEDEVSIGWDDCLFTGEDKNYQEINIDREKEYYPCIKLTDTLWNEIYTALTDNRENVELNDIGFIWDDTVPSGINALYENEEVSLEEIENLYNIYKTRRELLELQETVSVSEAEELEKLWTNWRNALYTRRPEAIYPQIYRIGSEAEIAFLQSIDNESELPFPVIMLTNADSYCSTYNIINHENRSLTEVLQLLNGKIGTLKAVEKEDGIGMKYSVNVISSSATQWIANNDLKKYKRVYPRIRIPYSNFIENNDDCKIYIKDDVQLEPYQDYTIMSRYDINEREDINDATFWLNYNDIDNAVYTYYITLSPDVMIRNNFKYGKYKFLYKLSNTALAIYLDAIEVLKENSIPKVNYNISPIIIKSSIIEDIFNWIHKIININDPELKFENVLGYISSVSLSLDAPWEDSFEVINYTTKFEDLFSSIVASTAQIQKNNNIISVASQAFLSTGEISLNTLSESIASSKNLSLKFNDNFIIDNNGIKALSDKGIVYYTDKGIFTATTKDDYGNWNWNTSIQPTGINAKSITTGQLDTNLIHIYSGNNLRFLMNGDGLFAYKSWLNENINNFTDENTIATIDESIKNRNGLDPALYVVMNVDGLFLTAKKGACLIDDNNYPVKIEQDVNRVEISWEGLVLRNNKNERTFFADPDTGNLNITGNITVEGNDISAELSENKLQFGNYLLVTTKSNNSECLSFVYSIELE